MMAACLPAIAAGPRTVEMANPKMTAYLPAGELANGQAVVICPGGGYTHLATGHEGYQWAPFFNELGYAAIVLEYTFPKGDRTLPMSDVEECFKVVADSASVWNISADKIGIMGSSAGGHLASTIATHPAKSCRPAFQILFYPVISLEKGVTHNGTADGFLGQDAPDSLRREWSNQYNVTAQTPPAFIVLSGDDTTVPPANSICTTTPSTPPEFRPRCISTPPVATAGDTSPGPAPSPTAHLCSGNSATGSPRGRISNFQRIA